MYQNCLNYTVDHKIRPCIAPTQETKNMNIAGMLLSNFIRNSARKLQAKARMYSCLNNLNDHYIYRKGY